jgi:uroporphyrin-III C-methyltransferase
MTARSLDLIAAADAIYYDRLIPPGALDGAREDAELIYVGKQPEVPSVPQEEIGERLIEAARADKSVVRLKGGDPFVFGRGGEEALALVAAGIRFRIVPGISAGIGGLAYAGIPVTHREVNSAVAFITGHDASGLVPDSVDWESLSRGAPVLVIYMALKHIEPIVERLLAAGRSPAEPIAVVSKATTAEQQVLESTLGRIVADVAVSGIEPPAMVVVGEAVRLRAGLDWLGALSGKRLIADPLGQKKRSESA